MEPRALVEKDGEKDPLQDADGLAERAAMHCVEVRLVDGHEAQYLPLARRDERMAQISIRGNALWGATQ